MKNRILFLMILLLCANHLSFSQYWEKGFVPDSTNGGMARGAVETPDGGIIFTSTPDFMNGNTVKTDVDGNVQWTKTYFGSSIIKTKDSNYLVAGQSNGNGIEVHKIDIAGNIIWQKSVLAGIGSNGEEVDTVSDGGFIIAGGVTQNNIDIALIKLDSLGNLAWYKTFGSANFDIASEVHETTDGGFILIGRQETTPATPEIIIIKTDSIGNLQWSNTYLLGQVYAVGTSIKQTFDGGYIASAFPYLAFKIDSIGNVLWDNYILNKRINSIVQLEDGNFIAVGEDDLNSFYSKFFWLKLDTMGNVIQTKSFKNDIGESNYLEKVNITSSGGFLMSGASQPSASMVEAYIIKTDSLGNPYSNGLFGKIVFDINQNCVEDSADFGITNLTVTAIKSNQQFNAISDATGSFFFGVTPGNYSVSAQIPLLYNLACPALGNYQVNLSTAYQSDSTLNFFITSDNYVRDLSVSITSTASPTSVQYWLSINNYGTASESGFVYLNFDSLLSFNYSSESFAFLQNDSIVFTYQNLAPFQTHSFLINLIPSGISIGYNLFATSCIFPVASDTLPSNNCAIDNRIVTGSFDPNYKESFSTGADSVGNISVNDILTYTLGFQNTGNDTAFTVDLRDTLSSNLDLSSFRVISSSHQCSISFLNSNILRIYYSNILLPDSNINEPLSHGFFKFSIKPKSTIGAGTVISNTGYIYFDFNPAVSTNTTSNAIINPTSIQSDLINSLNFSLFPNPANSLINISFNSTTKQKIELSVLNALGEQIYSIDEEISMGKFEKVINLNRCSAGIYFLRAKLKEESIIRRIVIQE